MDKGVLVKFYKSILLMVLLVFLLNFLLFEKNSSFLPFVLQLIVVFNPVSDLCRTNTALVD